MPSDRKRTRQEWMKTNFILLFTYWLLLHFHTSKYIWDDWCIEYSRLNTRIVEEKHNKYKCIVKADYSNVTPLIFWTLENEVYVMGIIFFPIILSTYMYMCLSMYTHMHTYVYDTYIHIYFHRRLLVWCIKCIRMLWLTKIYSVSRHVIYFSLFRLYRNQHSR